MISFKLVTVVSKDKTYSHVDWDGYSEKKYSIYSFAYYIGPEITIHIILCTHKFFKEYKKVQKEVS